MSEYIISCCTTADLSKEHFTNRNIHYICFHYFLDGKPYADDLGQSMPFDKFYEAMANGADTKTSQINMEEFVEYFEPFLQEGKDIIHLTLSSGISGVYNSAMLAKEELAEKYPDRKIYIIDSLAASSGYGLLMDKLADLRDEGMDIDTLAKWAEDNRLKLNHWFFSNDLTFYVKGGRISKDAGAIGGMLNICPLLNVDLEGRLIPRQKIRTKKKVIAAIAEKTGLTKKDAEGAVKAFTDTVAEQLKAGDKIQLVGFGTFEVAERAARTGKNPQTGEAINIPASKAPKFKAGKALKDVVNTPVAPAKKSKKK